MRINFWIRVALFNFLVAAIMGLALRAAFVWEINFFDYRNILKGHSHIAMQGWIYMALYALLIVVFVPKNTVQQDSYYRRLFLYTQLSVIGMMIAFPIQGYGILAIVFSTLNVIFSYLFAIKLWKDSRTSITPIVYLMRAALIGMIVSTLGYWAMMIMTVFKFGQAEWYYLSIQFYLHFQFNAWFILVAIAILIQYFIEKKKINIFSKIIKNFGVLYFLSVVLTFFHVLHWAYKDIYTYVLNSIGVALQFIAIVYLVQHLYKQHIIKGNTSREQWNILLYFALFSWLFKGLIQLFLVFPEASEISTVIRNFMIGYIHLINLGIVSILLFFLLKKFVPRFSFGVEIFIFLFGVIATELYLFLQGVFYWQAWGILPLYHITIFFLSALLPLGILIIWFRMIINNRSFLS